MILDLCGGSGAWSKPYKDAGYEVMLITLPEHDVCSFSPPEGVVGILAAPPCTEFSLAKGSSARDFREGMKCVEACMRIIWESRKRGSLKFWALENPRGFLRQFLGLPAMTFEHWQFGDDQIKPTDLWGYFKKPKEKPKEKPKGLTVTYPNGRKNGRGWAKVPVPPEYEHLSRQERRAITPPGFAKAFFEANR